MPFFPVAMVVTVNTSPTFTSSVKLPSLPTAIVPLDSNETMGALSKFECHTCSDEGLGPPAASWNVTVSADTLKSGSLGRVHGAWSREILTIVRVKSLLEGSAYLKPSQYKSKYAEPR